MKRIFCLSLLFISTCLSAMELEQTPEKYYLDKLPSEIQNIILLNLFDRLPDDSDIKDYYNAVKPLAVSNKYHAQNIPNWFVDWWYLNRNPQWWYNPQKKHSKVAIAALCGAGGWVKDWVKKSEDDKDTEEYNKNILDIFDNAVSQKSYYIINFIIPFLNDTPRKKVYLQSMLIRSINHADPELEKIAIKHGANPNEYSSDMGMPLVLPLKYAFDFFVIRRIGDQMDNNKRKEIIQHLLNAHADPLLPDQDGENSYQFLQKKYKRAIDGADKAEIQYYKEIKDLIENKQ